MNTYEKVTEAIVAQLRNGVIPWERPWVNGPSAPRNHCSMRPYSGVNLFLLSRPGEYLTQHQIQDLGGTVREGARSEFAVFRKKVEKDAASAEDEGNRDGYWVCRWYNLFHVEDVEGVEPNETEAALPRAAGSISIADADIRRFCSATGVRISSVSHGEPKYDAASDTVIIPAMERFSSTSDYYVTLLEGLMRSTGVQGRLDRGVENLCEASVKTAREDLVCSIAAAMAANVMGLEGERTAEQTAAKISRWVDLLEANPKMFVWAAKRAEDAARNFLVTAGVIAPEEAAAA